MKAHVSPQVQKDIDRLVSRFVIERMAAGWSTWDLQNASDTNRSVIERIERGDTIPTLVVLVRLAQVLGLRLDFVPEHLVPLLALDEFEVQALIVGATEGWRHATGWGVERHLTAALHKLGRLRGVQEGGGTVDAD